MLIRQIVIAIIATTVAIPCIANEENTKRMELPLDKASQDFIADINARIKLREDALLKDYECKLASIDAQYLLSEKLRGQPMSDALDKVEKSRALFNSYSQVEAAVFDRIAMQAIYEHFNSPAEAKKVVYADCVKGTLERWH